MSETDARDTQQARSLYKQGMLQLADGKVEEAVGSYREATEANPKLAIAWNGLSMALRQQGDVDGAIEAARRLIEIEPDDALSHTNLSILYQMKGMIQEAEDEKALAMSLEMRGRG